MFGRKFVNYPTYKKSGGEMNLQQFNTVFSMEKNPDIHIMRAAIKVLNKSEVMTSKKSLIEAVARLLLTFGESKNELWYVIEGLILIGGHS